MNRAFGRLFIPAAAMWLVCGCASARREEPLVGAWRPGSSESAKGQIVFMQNCHMCHPHGDGGLGPALNNKPLPQFAIRLQVRQGYGTMPAFSREAISPEQLEALAMYVAELRKVK